MRSGGSGNVPSDSSSYLSDRMTELGVPLAVNLISRIEKGVRVPGLSEIMALALALDVTPNRLMLTSEATYAPVELTPTTSAPAKVAW